jgi:hypothetical protein
MKTYLLAAVAVDVLAGHTDLLTRGQIPSLKLNHHPESPSTSQRFLQLANRGPQRTLRAWGWK